MSLPNLMHLHTKASSVNVNGDEKDLVIAQLKELRRGTRVIHQQVVIFGQSGTKEMTLAYSPPNGVDPKSVYGSHMVSGGTMLYKEMEIAVTNASPGNSMVWLQIQSNLYYKNMVTVHFMNDYNFNVDVCKELGQAFLTGLINDTIGTRCYVPIQSVVQQVWPLSPYKVYVTLANEGDCASHRLVGNEL